MKKRSFKWGTGIVAAMLAASSLAGCGSGKEESAATASPAASPAASGSTAPELAPVELSWYFPLPTVPADMQLVEEAVNKLVKAKINATVKLKPQAMGDYQQKMNVVAASGEKFDIAWTSNWSFDYIKNASTGAFLPLDDLLQKYAPQVLKSMPDFVWNATKYKGKIYGIPNYQTVTGREGFVVRKSYADKYGLDPAAIKKYEDIEPFLERVKAAEPNMIPFAYSKSSSPPIYALGIQSVAAGSFIRINDPNLTVTAKIGSAESDKYIETQRRWYKKGLINEDAAIAKTDDEVIKTGKAVSMFHTVLAADAAATYKTKFKEDVVIIPITGFSVTTNSIITTMNAVSRTSPNPERAAMFLNLVNTDKEIYNLLVYGIEGKHYKKVSDNVVEPVAGSGYNHNTSWVLGNTFNAYLTPDKDQKMVDQIKKDNESATPSPLMGFYFDPDKVSAEIAAVNSVASQYGSLLNSGAEDPAAKLQEYKAKTEQAGIAKIIAEAQRQLDEWRQSIKK